MALGVVVSPTCVYGHDTGKEVSVDEGGSRGQIIVTARKADEDIDQIPESVSVVPARALQSLPLAPFEALARGTPNLAWSNWGANSSFLSIRGVSSLGAPVNNMDGTISLSIDGVPASMLLLTNTLLDVDHIEVLRGPQGTLWGSNALGGAINVITRPPDGKKDFRLTSEVGSHGYAMVEVSAGGALVPDRLDARASFRINRYDGDIESLYTGPLARQRIAAFQGSLKWIVGDDTDATLRLAYSRNRDSSPFFLIRDTDDFPLSGSLVKPRQVARQRSASLNVAHDLGGPKLTFLASFQRNANSAYVDSTDALIYRRLGFPDSLIRSDPNETTDRESGESFEARLNSAPALASRWVIGISSTRNVTTREATLDPKFLSVTRLRTWNSGVFADASVPLVAGLSFSVGGRVSVDDIHVRDRSEPAANDNAGSDATHQTYLTGRASLSYTTRRGDLLYVSIARGHATRIYELYNQPTAGRVAPPYPAGRGWSYEAGAKVPLLEKRIQINISAFRNDIHDGVLTYLDPTASRFLTLHTNYHTTGFEIEGLAKLFEGLDLSAAAGYTRAILAGGSNADPFRGRRVPSTPDWTVSSTADYTTALSGLRLPGSVNGNVEYRYTGSRSVDVEQSFTLHPYSLVNARLGWRSQDQRISVYGFVRNLSNKRYEVYGASFLGVPIVMAGTGRIAGAGFSLRL